MTRTCSITTMHGLGNRLHLVHDDGSSITGGHASRACQLQPADGLLAYGRAEDGMHACVTWNADGSPAELCGNGIRCLALLGLEEGWLDAAGASLRSAAGVHQVQGEADGRVTVSMPMPVHGPGAVGLDVDRGDGFTVHGDRVEYACDDAVVELVLVSTGNPHAIVFAPAAVHDSMLPGLGPALQSNEAFTNGINVHVAQVTGDILCLQSWERGVGSTAACATGATAAVAAAIARGLVERGATVRMPGGELEVRIESGVAWNTGTAEHVRRWTMDMEPIDADPPICS